MEPLRCGWVTDDPLYEQYHDEEWGRFDLFFNDCYLFEMLTLEGAQAGLNWLTILKRREHYRRAFCQFDPACVAQFTGLDVERLLLNKGIIRNRLKIKSTIQNSKAILKLQDEFGSFHQFLWDFVDQKRTINSWKSDDEVPAQTEQSRNLSKTLQAHGFTFVGPIICYSFMQAVGLVDDHLQYCLVRQQKGNR